MRRPLVQIQHLPPARLPTPEVHGDVLAIVGLRSTYSVVLIPDNAIQSPISPAIQ